MNQRNYIDPDEKEIIETFENDEWKSITNIEEEKEKHAAYARNTFLKNKRINIKITEKDFLGLKQRSLEEGISYQSLISSILHKYLNGKLIDSELAENNS